LKLSDSEDESARTPAKPSSKPTEAKTASAARVKRGVVVSDDEDEEASKPSPPPPARPKAAYKTKAKATIPDSNAEKELRAMMDIDDGRRRFIVLG
jgi:DNA polymerase delta subunit 3